MLAVFACSDNSAHIRFNRRRRDRGSAEGMAHFTATTPVNYGSRVTGFTAQKRRRQLSAGMIPIMLESVLFFFAIGSAVGR